MAEAREAREALLERRVADGGVLYGSAGGPPDPIAPLRLFEKGLRVSGFVVPMVYGMQELHRRGLDDVFRLAHEGRLTVPIGGHIPLERAADALRLLASRRSTGKLLLLP